MADHTKYDGELREWVFAPPGSHRGRHYSLKKVVIETDTLEKAIRRFRIGTLHPYQYVKEDDQIIEERPTPDGYERDVIIGCKLGARVGVFVKESHRLIPVCSIEALGEIEDKFSHAMLPASAQQQAQSSALVRSDAPTSLEGISTDSRQIIESKILDLEAQQGRLEMEKRELQQQVSLMKEEIKRRLEQIWMIELYIGTHEEVHHLRQGLPAAAETPITVRQRVLCMDEEVAVYDWSHNPERIGKFDFKNLQDFDNWLLADEAHLDAVLPEKKGIVCLRVRRRDKEYFPDDNSWAAAMANIRINEANQKTYFLIRNGENVYRIWADITLWPTLFPTRSEFDLEKQKDKLWYKKTELENKHKHYVAGTLAVQGILDRSDILYPYPIHNLSMFNPQHQQYFHMIRDAEDDRLLEDGKRIGWEAYKEWLQTQVKVGTRVLFVGEYTKLEHRVFMRSVYGGPTRNTLYVIDRKEKKDGYMNFEWSFLYHPGDEVYGNDWNYHERKNRVRFHTYSSEVLPVDALSWRVLHSILNNRYERENYHDSFLKLWNWAKMKREEEARERPFAELVLNQVNEPVTDENVARVHRLIRWWKLKTKFHRALSDDEPKALRMIVKAYKQGEDYEEDPEKGLVEDP